MIPFAVNPPELLPFSEIDLEGKDSKRLRYLLRGTLYSVENDALLRHRLAEEIKVMRSPGGMPVPTGKIKITDRGRSYLQHRRHEWLRFWIPVGISALSLIVSALSLYLSFRQQ